MVCSVTSLGLAGVAGYPVAAECALSGGLPAFDVVGLPDAAVREARERVRAAVKSSGFDFPVSRITVNLAPADRRKGGTVYDLPILVGILCAGGHHVLMSGCPGSGKSMMAKRLPSILPDMTRGEALACTEIYSVIGLTSKERPMVRRRPFRAPHHTISAAGMTGGGSSPRPGEISLAHNGVLFLDELPEFHADVLEVLRQPLEDGQTQISRVSGSVTYPSRFMLVCAMNPCRCGWYGHPSGRCACTEQSVRRYLSRLSGPMLDRIDICVDVPSLDYDELSGASAPAEGSAAIRARVNAARAVQTARYGPDGPACNAQMGPRELREHCKLDGECQRLIRGAYDRLGLTARGYDRILRVARTIADLDGAGDIAAQHLAEALQYRPPEHLRA